MSRPLKFVKCLALSQFPRDWSASYASVDWEGNPLLLVQDGKPPYPLSDMFIDAQAEWLNAMLFGDAKNFDGAIVRESAGGHE